MICGAKWGENIHRKIKQGPKMFNFGISKPGVKAGGTHLLVMIRLFQVWLTFSNLHPN